MLRVVGGTLGGRRFAGPPGSGTRPMSERVREALASALESRDGIAGANVLDLFAGTGALSFESISRGAAQALLVEHDRKTARTIERSAAQLGIDDRVRVVSLDLFAAPDAVASRLAAAPEAPFGLAFVAPPYKDVPRTPPLVEALVRAQVFTTDSLVVLEHATRTPLDVPHGLVSVARYRYGDTSLLLAQVGP